MEFDFVSSRDRMRTDLQAKASWADVLFFSTNNRLIDSVAQEINRLSSYMEFLVRNNKWKLATEKSALTTNAQFMQYDPYRKKGSTGILRISSSATFDSAYAKIVSIPKWSVFSDGDEIKFTTYANESLVPSVNYIDLNIVQGEPKSVSFIATGEEYEEFSLTNSNIENTYYELYVNDVEWTEVDDLNDSSSTDTHFELKNKVNFDGIDIKVGNDIFGKKLTEGDVVVLKYIETLGAEGNILSSGIITTVESTIYDEDSNQVDLYCTNQSSLDGGEDEETVEHIRANGTDAFQAGDKAVAQKDYRVRLENSNYILKATVWGAFEYNKDNNNDIWDWVDTQENLVYVSAITPGGANLTGAQKTAVITEINEDKPPTDIVSFVNADFVYLAFHVDAYVEDESYVLSEVKAAIKAGLESEYSYEHMDFFEHIYDTVWKSYIKSIDGVKYHTSYIELIDYPTFASAYQASFALAVYPIEPESITVYVRDDSIASPTWILMGTDDGEGGFIAESPFDLTGSTVNYTTGEGSLIVVSGLSKAYTSYSLKIYYQTSLSNLCLHERNQIFTVEETSDIETYYADDTTCQ